MSTSITHLTPNDLNLAETKPALIAVSPVVSIQTALNMMHKNRITSLPVFSHDSIQIVSIVNLFDILLYLVDNRKMVEKDKFRLNDPVENVLGLDSDRESYWLHKTDSQDTLLETLRAFASGAHRSLVIDYSDPQKGPWLLSQTDIIRHIHKHPECISELDINASVKALCLVHDDKPLSTINASQPALEGYQLMAEKNLSGVPIVDSNGNIVGDLCLEYLPSASLETADQLDLPSIEYIKTIARPLPTATQDTTLKEILDIMTSQDVHRVWIKQNADAPKVIGVVTMSDIIGLLCQKHNH